MPLVMKMECAPAKIIIQEINVKIALQNITTLPTPAILVSATKMVLSTKIVMPMENVHARKRLLVTNVISLNLATMTLQIQKNVTAMRKVLKIILVMTKENATVDVTSKETNVTNVIQNIMVS